MDSTIAETLDRHGYPLAFKVMQGESRSPVLDGVGQDVFKVEARQLAGHQKEAIVAEGARGSSWRLVSDEGPRLLGTDLAPFPLGFFNAGIQCDLYRRLRSLAHKAGLSIEKLELHVTNGYGLTGSFVHGTGEGHADPSDIEIKLTMAAEPDHVCALVRSALDESPAIAYLRTAMKSNTFALYINGRRRQVEGVSASTAGDARDPYQVYTHAPAPLTQWSQTDLIEKTSGKVIEDTAAMPASTDKRIGWQVLGSGTPIANSGMFSAETWLGRPGTTHFCLKTDEGRSDAAPSGLVLFSAAIAFCYMTQLSRYIENMKMRINGVRLVQFNPYSLASGGAKVGPIDTHLFLNGDAPEETHLKLLTVAAHTCYLHAAARAVLEPRISLTLNGASPMRIVATGTI